MAKWIQNLIFFFVMNNIYIYIYIIFFFFFFFYFIFFNLFIYLFISPNDITTFPIKTKYFDIVSFRYGNPFLFNRELFQIEMN